MDADTVIKIEHLSKTFYIPEDRKFTLKSLVTSFFKQGRTRKFEALKDINLEIHKGDFVGLIGRNGSGKSTLLKMIAGIYYPDKGSLIKVRGRLVPFLELGVGFNPELSGRENIFLNGTILGMTRQYIKAKYDEIVDFAELREFIEMPVKNYSSGMMVRLAFSIAVQTDADIYILDEILGVGDAAFQKKSIGIINKFIEEGKTLLYVSHDLNSVKKYCNKVAWIKDSTIAAYSSDVEKVTEEYRLYLEKQA